MTEMQREAEARLCNSTAGFIVTGLCVISLGVVVDMFWVCIVGLVSLVLAGLTAACIIALPAFTDEELKKILKQIML